jgi:dTDP-4-amino-4,6-dideoxygalactose transaminase
VSASDLGQRMPIPLSAPHQTGTELEALTRVIESNWLASVGPEVTAFESEFADALSASSALATGSGTAAIHLALRVLGVKPGDEVLVSTLTFCASVNPILYLGATPVFIDSEEASWNMDPALLAEELDRRGNAGRLPAAVIVVHLYGQLADLRPILEACARWDVPLVEDAAEALGATTRGEGAPPRAAGTLGTMGIFSFDGSKMITTSVGGMLVSDRPGLVAHARKLSRQAREPVEHYEHTEMGYNYRMSNVLAALGRAQLPALAARVAARRAVARAYAERLAGLPGISLQPEGAWGVHARWLTCILVDPDRAGIDRGGLQRALRAGGAESRPVWKPMHQQPVYQAMGLRSVGGTVADRLFERGLCLPSSSSLTMDEIDRVCALIRTAVART